MEETQTSAVYFANLRARKAKESKIKKIAKLFNKAGFKQSVVRDGLCAVKIHFGERGNDTFLSPVLVRAVIDKIKEANGKPFLTDTNTLYSGSRFHAVDHLITAIEHGFDYAVTGAPLIIADGLRSNNIREVAIDGNHFQKVKLATDIVDADCLFALSHFKGHELAGFGGTIKNLAMGCAPRQGKKEQHCVRFFVEKHRCVGCGECRKVCPQDAITVTDRKASIETALCIGCGECLTVCQNKSIMTNWETEMQGFTERMVEYAKGALTGKKGRTAFFNFLINITPDCDCVPWSDAPIVPDIGILCSHDPVALDKASLDLVNAQMGIAGTHLKTNHHPGEHKFNGLWDNTMGDVQISYAEKIGLGSSQYELIRI